MKSAIRLAPRDPRDMAKARLLEVQSRSEYPFSSCYADYQQDIPSPTKFAQWRRTRWGRHLKTIQGVGMSGQPKPRYNTTSGKHEIPYGARALRERSLNSSRRTGKPSTWRSEAGSSVERLNRGTRDA
jgi:hypothetical protein